MCLYRLHPPRAAVSPHPAPGLGLLRGASFHFSFPPLARTDEKETFHKSQNMPFLFGPCLICAGGRHPPPSQGPGDGWEAVVGGGGAHCAAGWEWLQGTHTFPASARPVLSPAGLCRNCLIKGEAWSPRWGPGPLGGSVGSVTVVGEVSTEVLHWSTLSYCSVTVLVAP